MRSAIGLRPGCIHSVVIFLLALATVASANFATFQGDNQRTGNLSGTGPDQANLLWSASLTGHGYVGAAAAISGERIFVSNWQIGRAHV